MLIYILSIPAIITVCTVMWCRKFNKFNRETAEKWGFKPVGWGYVIAVLPAALPLAFGFLMFMGAGFSNYQISQSLDLTDFGDGLLFTGLAALWLAPWCLLLFFQTKAKSDEATAWKAVRMLVLTAVGAGGAVFGLLLARVIWKEHQAEKMLDPGAMAGAASQSFGEMGLGDKRDEVVWVRR